MGSGGGGDNTTTTRNQLPAWATGFAKDVLGQAAKTYFPGGQLLPASQGVAVFSPDQLAAMQMVEQLSGVVPNAGANYINYTAGPASNNQQPPTVGPQGAPNPGPAGGGFGGGLPIPIVGPSAPGGGGSGGIGGGVTK